MRRFDALGDSAAILLALTISGYPIVAIMAELLAVESQTVTVPFRAMVIGISIALVLLSLSSGRYRLHPRFLPLILFWVIYSFRLAEAVVLGGEYDLSVRQPMDYLLFGWGLCLVPMVALMAAYPSSAFRRGLNLTFGLTLLGGLGLVAMLLAGRTSLIPRASLAFLNSISYGNVGTSLTLLSVVIFLRRKRGSFHRLVLISSAALGLFLIGLSGSRAPFLAVVVVGALLLFSGSWRGRRRRAAILVLITILAAPALFRFTTHVLSAGKADSDSILVVERLRSITDSSSALDARVSLWRNGLAFFAENPLFGGGVEDPESKYYPHNLVLESFMATGIFGGIAAVVALMFGIATSVRLLRGESSTQWVGVLFLQYCLGALFSGSLWGATKLWPLLGAVYGLEVSRRTPKVSSALGPATRR